MKQPISVSYIISDITIKCHKTVINQRFYAIFSFLCGYINLEIAKHNWASYNDNAIKREQAHRGKRSKIAIAHWQLHLIQLCFWWREMIPMNQKGNEPMTMLHAYISVDLMNWINTSATESNVGKSEFVRLALEYIRQGDFPIVQKTIFKPNSER